MSQKEDMFASAGGIAEEETGSGLDVELTTRPESLDALVHSTRFSRAELRILYRGFKEASPMGTIHLQRFRDLFLYWFPTEASAKASDYPRMVFATLDTDDDGVISFEEFVSALSVMSRGSLQEKLRWIFALYDQDGDGYVGRDEIGAAVQAMHDIMGPRSLPHASSAEIGQHAEDVFQRLDLHQEGQVSWTDFEEAIVGQPSLLNSLGFFDTKMGRGAKANGTARQMSSSSSYDTTVSNFSNAHHTASGRDS